MWIKKLIKFMLWSHSSIKTLLHDNENVLTYLRIASCMNRITFLMIKWPSLMQKVTFLSSCKWAFRSFWWIHSVNFLYSDIDPFKLIVLKRPFQWLHQEWTDLSSSASWPPSSWPPSWAVIPTIQGSSRRREPHLMMKVTSSRDPWPVWPEINAKCL